MPVRYLLDRKSTSVVPVQRRAWDRDLMVYKRDLEVQASDWSQLLPVPGKEEVPSLTLSPPKF